MSNLLIEVSLHSEKLERELAALQAKRSVLAEVVADMDKRANDLRWDIALCRWAANEIAAGKDPPRDTRQ